MPPEAANQTNPGWHNYNAKQKLCHPTLSTGQPSKHKAKPGYPQPKTNKGWHNSYL